MSNKDSRYLRIAEIWAENSKAKRKKVGAIIVKNKMIISDGYNGTPSGFPNECETALYDRALGYPIDPLDDDLDEVNHDPTGWETKPEVLHAEANAILSLIHI